MTKNLLTVRKEKWVKQFKPAYLKGPVLSVNSSIQIRYIKATN